MKVKCNSSRLDDNKCTRCHHIWKHDREESCDKECPHKTGAICIEVRGSKEG